MQKAKRLGPITDNLNKSLEKLLENFSYSTEWTDIINWLKSLQATLRDNPSPYINEKVLLSKRLNQCINPILPDKVHEEVLVIHQLLFLNIRTNVDNNINEYAKLFADDLGIYSLSILPYFAHTTSFEHKMRILKMFNDYYLDLGLQLIPMLIGFIKCLLPVYNQTNDQKLMLQIENFINKLLRKAGRRYVISSIWSCILKYSDCRNAGMKFLGKLISKMQFKKDQGEFESEHGFSQQEEQLKRQLAQQLKLEESGLKQSRRSLQQIKNQVHLNNQSPQRVFSNRQINYLELPKLDEKPQSDVQLSKIQSTKTEQSYKHGEAISSVQSFPPENFEKKELKVEPPAEEQPKIEQKVEPVQPPIQQSPAKKLSQDQKNENNLIDNIKEDIKPSNTPNKQSGQLAGSNSQRNLRLLATSQGLSSAFANHQKLSEDGGHAIKLDKVPLMLTPGMEIIKQGIDNDTNENNYPHHNTLVVNALIACLEDSSQFIKKSVLDFMFSHLRLKSDVLDENDRHVLVEAGIRLFKKKEVSITKRVNRWMFGKENEEGVYEITERNQFVLPYIVHAFKKILQTQPKDIQNCVIPLKIVQNFYMEHSHLIDMTITQIGVDILRYIFNYSTGHDFSEEIVKAGNRFFSNIPSHYPLLFKSLGGLFVQGIHKNDDHLSFQCVRYIDYCYIKLMKHEHGIQEMQYITITLMYLSQGLKQFAATHTQSTDFYRIYLRDTTLLIYNLLSRRQSVERYMLKEQENVDKKYLQETGKQELPVERIQYQEELRNQQQKQKISYIEILNRIQIFFNTLGIIIKKTPNIQMFEDIYKLTSMSMVKIQYHLPKGYTLKQLPKWFNTIQYGIRVSSPAVSLAAIQAMIKCLMFEEKHPIYAQFKKFTMDDKSKKVGSDYQHLALQKLWSLLDYPHMHSKIIDLIVAFSKFFPYEFTQTVKRSFETSSDPEKEASIQRFSHFWRLTGFKYKDLLISNRQFAQLNKVGLFKMLDFLDDQNPLVRHAAKNWMTQSMPLFYRVIQPLFYELMKVGGDWYTTPKGLLIIRNNYDTNIVFSTFRRIRSLLANGTFAFLRYVYQQSISDRLQELREKVTPLSTSILTQSKQKQNLPMAATSLQKEPVLPKALQYVPDTVKEKRMAYIDMLIILCVKFVQGVAIQSMGIDFYTGNAGVNTSAIQLLQSMINYIDNPGLCYKLISYIMEPLCKVLNQAVINQEYITQIQLLNLLKTIFFNSSFRQKGSVEDIRAFFKGIFTKQFFMSSMLNGLYTPFAYVRAQFINFITTCIELIANFLDPDQCTQCIKKILFTYYMIIKEIRVSLIEEVLQEQDNSLELINEVEQRKRQTTLGLSRIVEMEIKAKQEEKIVKLSNNLQEVAKTNEILSILHGVSAILNYFYDLEKMNISDMKFQVSNPYTIFDSFKSIITLGLASSEKLGRLVEKTQFLHNMQTAQSILKDLSPVYQTILRAWPLSEEFVRIATEEFTSVGSRNFNFEKFSHYNKVLLDLINFVSKEKQTIWGKIFTILKPMFYRFPRQIMEIYLKLWIRECTNVGENKGPANFNQKLNIKPSILNTEFLMKILETVIVSNFPMNIIVHAFLQNSMLQQIRTYYSSNKRKDGKSVALSYHISQMQAKLLYFLYAYFMYSYIDEKELTKENLLGIWSVILKSVRPFINSPTPTTSMWILDIINMCAIKYSPKEVLTNQKFKTDLHGVVNQLLKQVANIASKKEVIFYDDPTKINFKENQSGNNADKFRLILPIPPSLFQIYKTKTKDRLEIDKELFIPLKAGDVVALEKINRLWCFKTLKRIGYQILQNTYLTQKTHFAVIRACEWMEIILPTIEDKSTQNMIYAESASQVLYSLLEQARILFIKPLRNSIIRIFDKDDFFICNKNTLNYWAKIIDWVVSIDKNNETFSEYLSKVSLSSSYFTSESAQNKKRIKSFQRICFILYSGSQDKYAFKIKGLLEKIADVIKIAEAAHPALLILILFSIRILILRLSQISLNQLFIDIWPMILAFLMQIFSKKLVKVEIANQISRNPNLLLAALKLIEMISISNLSEFAHHQWIFIFDYFGVKISLSQNTIELGQILNQRPELTQLVTFSRNQNPTPFFYKPYMMNYLAQHSIEYRSQDRKVQHIQYQPMKRVVVVKNSFIRTEDELKAYVYLLAQYLVRLDEYRMHIDQKDIQEVIINDFIKLDSFIHKI